jgi:YidC/Oxa1 family membrane protein insertase
LLVTVLTKHTGILGPVADVLGLVMNAIYNFFNLFGIQNIALSIFIFTFLVRACLLPFTIKQQKFAKLSSRMNPELQKIQAKYKGKKDEVSLRKQQEETQAVYQKYGANPTSGCLPLVIQLPIMFALYYVIYNIPAYVDKVKGMYEKVAVAISNTSQYAGTLKDMSKGVANASRLTDKNFDTTNGIIDLLAKFDHNKWNELATKFPNLNDLINHSYSYIRHANSFFGLNIADSPISGPHKFLSWAILIPIIAAVLQFIQGKQSGYSRD